MTHNENVHSVEAINEDMHLEKEWFKTAKEMTIDELPTFIDHVMGDYKHDYGTLCHAIASCALAAAYAANRHKNGCITGFQAGFTLFDFIREWQYPSNKAGLKIINYDDMLFPQHEYKFQKTIKKSTWESLQEEAQKLLDEPGTFVHPAVMEHWESIVNGRVPFGYAVEEKE